VGSWGAPLAACAFWAGLLAWDGRPAAFRGWPAWAWLAAGLATLAAAWIAAPRTGTGDALARAGLAADEPAAVTAVRAPAADGRRGPHLALALLTIGVFVCGVGWGGVAQTRREVRSSAGSRRDRSP
jgi:hypothetical protein